MKIIFYTGGILEPCLYKAGKTPAERLEDCETGMKAMQSSMDEAVAELTMLIAGMGGGV